MSRRGQQPPQVHDAWAIRWALAQWALAIWNPDLMDIAHITRRKSRRLYYRAKGIVCHDRVLNGEGVLRGDAS